MKRVTSLALAAVILLGVLFVGAVPVAAESALTASDECIKILKAEEGFSKTPYWDYSQYTVGYGTRCPDDMVDHYTTNGITEEEAETLLRNHLTGVYDDLNKYADKNSLTWTQNQFDALVLFSYNCGTGWLYDKDGTLPKALLAGATGNDLIRAFAVWCSAGGEIKSYLLRRRLSEANMYLNNVYSQTPPDNYCYVLYDANGGVSKPRSQGYDSQLTAAPFPVPTYEGYTFDGWYTEKNGGTKVTVLDASTKGDTLYAHWKTADGKDVVEEEKQVTVKVTSDDVNVRKGPGTNYTIVGQKSTGDKLLITETASGSGYRWGKFDGGWICLQYTNYDEAVKDADNSGDTTGTPDDVTKPEDTTDPTEPETTVPETTAPETTVPETTAPEQKPEAAKVMGTVKVDGYLNVRSGTSTGYSVVGQLKNGERVEILEQKTVGAMVWGKISKGWISMDYVKLDSTASSSGSGSTGSTGTTTAKTWTGTIVNCSEWLRIRSGAGLNYSIAGYLYPGDKVTITEQKTVGSMNWGKIDKGWISMDYVKLDSTTGSTGSTTTQKKTGTVVTDSGLRIRSAAGTSSTVVGYLSNGAKVEILQTTDVNGSTWGKIAKGWISMDYVKLDGTASGSTGSAGTTGTTGSTTTTQTVTGTVYNCSSYLNVRNGAGTSYSVVAYLYAGDKVTVTEKKTVGSATWGKTAKGWVSMDYIKLDSGTSTGSTTQSQTKTVTASCLCVRKTAGISGTIVGYLYYGAKVSILETTTVGSTTWGRTSNGWISLDYAK